MTAPFTVTVPNLEAGKYTARFGFAETEVKTSGLRLFDIATGDHVVATNFDIIGASGGEGEVCYFTAQVEHSGDARRGNVI